MDHRPSLVDAAANPSSLVVVLVPAFNEEKSIGPTISGLLGLRAPLAEQGLDLAIFVVDDGSTDKTATLATASGADRILRHRVNQGLGAAVRTGLTAARQAGAAIAVKYDADLQHSPQDVLELIRPIVEDEADLVYGNRFERIAYRMPWERRIGNQVFTGLMRRLTGWPLKDSQPGIFAADSAYLSVFSLPGDYNYTQQVLLDAYHKGMRFAHVPVDFKQRTSGRSFVSFRYPMKVLPQILMVLVSVKPLRVFGTAGFVAVALALLLSAWQIIEWATGNSSRPVENVNLVMALLLFGFQSLFFGLIAQLVIITRK